MKADVRNIALWLSILRRGARIVALLFIVFSILWFIGERNIWKHSAVYTPTLSFKDYLFLFLCGMYVVGLVVGLWWERLGGLLSLAFIVALMVMLSFSGMKYLNNFYIMLLPSLLYICSWYFQRKFTRQNVRLGQ